MNGCHRCEAAPRRWRPGRQGGPDRFGVSGLTRLEVPADGAAGDRAGGLDAARALCATISPLPAMETLP